MYLLTTIRCSASLVNGVMTGFWHIELKGSESSKSSHSLSMFFFADDSSIEVRVATLMGKRRLCVVRTVVKISAAIPWRGFGVDIVVTNKL